VVRFEPASQLVHFRLADHFHRFARRSEASTLFR
jgi:hypothetical protein